MSVFTFELGRGSFPRPCGSVTYLTPKAEVARSLGQNITHGSSFHVVLETIPSMMSALRMVWIISRHYNKDERMIPLMERIAWEIAERVCKVVNLRTLFK